ncbi:SUKH-4 family immunity protein [Streptomyces sp. MBT65]|uniref:SUKH-4 family immunity protein n=1 Tax=Streptomyces sp. MBT65 TaxID=1488395 RepID=UPI00190CA5FD|nr:SUKH-4 family immunity protein [Streptomyces sp. MBT65]MBK3576605.1 SUKH-4 family immunity protein [Streptomyces sp. MBT65]
MSRTDVAQGYGSTAITITLTEDDLDPYITHASTRRWLTGPGLPGDSALLTFEELRRAGLRTVADSLGDPGPLAEELRDQLVIGALWGPDGGEAESILLDGETGEIATTYFFHDRPDLMETGPLAPSIETLTRFTETTDELTHLRGQFASYEGRRGPKTAAEASRRLLAVFESETDGEVPPFWKAAALIRPLALVAGPGTTSGLTLDIPARLLDQEFGHGTVARFEEVDFPATLTHEPTRRFLRETGLPEDAFLFHLDTDVPLPTLTEFYEDAPTEELPPRADQLIRLGYLLEDNSLVVDGATGEILTWSEPEGTLAPLNTDVSTLAFTLWLLHREKTIDADLSGELTAEAYDQLATTMLQTLSSVDPTGRAARTAGGGHPHYWTEAFQDEAGGVL